MNIPYTCLDCLQLSTGMIYLHEVDYVHNSRNACKIYFLDGSKRTFSKKEHPQDYALLNARIVQNSTRALHKLGL